MRNATTRMSTTPIRVSFGSDSVICGRGSGMSQYGTEHPSTILSQKKDFGFRMSDFGSLSSATRACAVNSSPEIRHPTSEILLLRATIRQQHERGIADRVAGSLHRIPVAASLVDGGGKRPQLFRPDHHVH